MSYYVMLDTETTNSIEDPIAYDIGFAVIDENANIIESYSFVVAEVFLDKELMSSAYFADKIPQYWDDIQKGSRELRKLDTIRRTLNKVCKQYDVKAIVAHNARFDYRSTAVTRRYITTSKYRYFLPYGIELWDTLKMAREVFKTDDAFGQFCYDNDFLTSRGVRRYTAEILYRFLTNDVSFEEAHTGLEDVKIEAVIFAECLRRGATKCKLWES
jgi:DNA polymerase III epsilon subunit-like protein